MQLILNTVRKIDNDQTRELAFGDKSSLEEQLAIAYLNPKKVRELQLPKTNHIKITNEAGSIIVKALEDENVPDDSILLPISIWANQVTRVMNDDLAFKNITVNVDSTDEPITKFEDIITKIKSG
ncbi:MAG: molybdopterin dinucleotide binding domain-containing protein [Candidatus Thorarchaeota archaeon]